MTDEKHKKAKGLTPGLECAMKKIDFMDGIVAHAVRQHQEYMKRLMANLSLNGPTGIEIDRLAKLANVPNITTFSTVNAPMARMISSIQAKSAEFTSRLKDMTINSTVKSQIEAIRYLVTVDPLLSSHLSVTLMAAREAALAAASVNQTLLTTITANLNLRYDGNLVKAISSVSLAHTEFIRSEIERLERGVQLISGKRFEEVLHLEMMRWRMRVPFPIDSIPNNKSRPNCNDRVGQSSDSAGGRVCTREKHNFVDGTIVN